MGRAILVPSVVLVSLFSPPVRSDEPASCSGAEAFQVEIQGSDYYDQNWTSGYLWIYGQPYQQVTVMVRTRMTVTSGQTEGWSFSVEHDPSGLEPYGGSVSISAVTTEGTDTATVANGSPPSWDATEARSGFDGYTQGIVVDTSSQITLGPTSDFVTSLACYTITMPYYSGYFTLPLSFSHDIGDPNVRTVISQGGSKVPCAKKFEFAIYVDSSAYPSNGGCAISQQQSQSSGQGEYPALMSPRAGVMEGGQAQGAEQGPEVFFFRRGDSDASGIQDVSDPIASLNYQFAGTFDPPCLDALDFDDSGVIDISDPISNLVHQFVGGAPPPAPGPPPNVCGFDPTPDFLGCASYAVCGPDGDGDGLPDQFEQAVLGTSTSVEDLVGEVHDSTGEVIPDGKPDGWDTDLDGFSDAEEILPIGVGAEVDFVAFGADPLKRDIFIEIDWLQAADHGHKPNDAAIARIRQVFANAPVEVVVNGQVMSQGITAHIDVGQGGLFNGGNAIVEESTTLDTWPFPPGCSPNGQFDRLSVIKWDPNWGKFDPARRNVFHYGLIVHNASALAPGQGAGALPGENFYVSTGPSVWSLYDSNRDGLADFDDPNGADRIIFEATAILHELGHNLELHHGGPRLSGNNCMRNYVSLMNYRFAGRGYDTDCDGVNDAFTLGSIQFSDGSRDPLRPGNDWCPVPGNDPSELREPEGLCMVGSGLNCGDPGAVFLDWDGDGVCDDVDNDGDGQPDPVVPISWGCDLDMGETLVDGTPFFRCTGFDEEMNPICDPTCPAPGEEMRDYNDWTLMVFNGPRRCTAQNSCGTVVPGEGGGGNCGFPALAYCFDE